MKHTQQEIYERIFALIKRSFSDGVYIYHGKDIIDYLKYVLPGFDVEDEAKVKAVLIQLETDGYLTLNESTMDVVYKVEGMLRAIGAKPLGEGQ